MSFLFLLSIHFTDVLQDNVNGCMQHSVYRRMGYIWTFIFILLSYHKYKELDAGSMRNTTRVRTNVGKEEMIPD